MVNREILKKTTTFKRYSFKNVFKKDHLNWGRKRSCHSKGYNIRQTVMCNKHITGQPAFTAPGGPFRPFFFFPVQTSMFRNAVRSWRHSSCYSRALNLPHIYYEVSVGVNCEEERLTNPFLLFASVRKQVCHNMNILFPQRNYFPHYSVVAAPHNWFHTWLVQMMLQVVQLLSDTWDKNLSAGVKTQAVFIRVSISLKALQQTWLIRRQKKKGVSQQIGQILRQTSRNISYNTNNT